jgi:hypothetical protein
MGDEDPRGGAFDFYLEVLCEPAASAEVRSMTPRRGTGRYCGRVVSSQDIAVSMYFRIFANRTESQPFEITRLFFSRILSD